MSEDVVERRAGGPEFRLFGPPGTGKTTTLSKMISSTARARGSEAVIAASFTVTAAQELAGRDLPIPKRQVGTLHSLAFRSLGTDARVVEEELADWNKTHAQYSLTLKPGVRAQAIDDGAPIEAFSGTTEGDKLMGEMEKCRARLINRDLWPRDVQQFATAWEGWKADNDLIDFTDMIELALRDVETAPGNPEVGFFDEVQDFTRLELALIRKWGQPMERIILAGDDDQCLYRFKGATPDSFLNPPVDDIDKRVLEQSYRVPARVHAAAEAWICQIPSVFPDKRREPKTYLPRDADGEVGEASIHFQDPGAFANEIEFRLAAHEGNVMVLAPCSYMLDPVKHELKARGIPFHNPFRLKRGDWNPMRPSTSRTTASKDRLLAYLIIDERMFGEASRLWNGRDVQRWTHVVKSQGVFVKGAKDRINGLPLDDLVTFETLEALFADPVALEQATTPDLQWFEANMLAASRDAMKFPIAVARKDPKALLAEPRVILGTIHSVKGGQADTVLLIPDLSSAGGQEWVGPPGEARDSVIRQMYVGMTRARERLLICQPSTTRSVPPHELLKGVA